MKKTGFIFAILTLVFSVIPFLTYFGGIFGTLALIFGIVSIIKDGRAGEPKNKSLTTIIMASIGLALSIIMSIVYFYVIFGAAARSMINSMS